MRVRSQQIYQFANGSGGLTLRLLNGVAKPGAQSDVQILLYMGLQRGGAQKTGGTWVGALGIGNFWPGTLATGPSLLSPFAGSIQLQILVPFCDRPLPILHTFVSDGQIV